MKKHILMVMAAFFVFCGLVFAQNESISSGQSTYSDKTVDISVNAQHETVAPGAESALMLKFETKPGWHFYAENKPDPTGKFEVVPTAEGVIFGEPIYPEPEPYQDEYFGKYGIYEGEFKVFIPFETKESAENGDIPVQIKISGAACKDICIRVDAKISTEINVDAAAPMQESVFEMPTEGDILDIEPAPMAVPKHNALTYFALALIAGILLNIMPCVWPMIPIIITRLWNLSGHSRAKSTAEGIEFSLGILLFFAVIAVLNIILRLGFNVVFQLGDHFRHPVFVTAMSMLMLAMGLFMFGIFNFNLPPSVLNRASQGEERSGAVGMGFLLALLSTPCSFGILAAAFAWAQTQPIVTATFTIMLIGVGMAIPYLLLTSIPGLLNKMPKAGGWMERVKQTMGFVLLVVAVKLISALPAGERINTIYFAIILSFAIWMWGGWITFSTPKNRKYLIRILALLFVIAGGWLFLGTTEEVIEWNDYDRTQITSDLEQGKPVLIKFTADWCTTCTVVDRLVYSREDIGDLIKEKGVVPYIGDTTSIESQATLDLKNIYTEPGVPVSVLHMPDGEILKLVGMGIKDKLTEHLEALNDAEN